jgi:hypothetical protein
MKDEIIRRTALRNRPIRVCPYKGVAGKLTAHLPIDAFVRIPLAICMRQIKIVWSDSDVSQISWKDRSIHCNEVQSI